VSVVDKESVAQTIWDSKPPFFRPAVLLPYHFYWRAFFTNKKRKYENEPYNKNISTNTTTTKNRRTKMKRLVNKEAHNQRMNEYRYNNLEKFNEYQKHYLQHNDVKLLKKLADMIKRRLFGRTKKFSQKSQALFLQYVGCSIDYAAAVLQYSFFETYGMLPTRQNCCIDHIVPVAAVKRGVSINVIGHLHNLRLVPPVANIDKKSMDNTILRALDSNPIVLQQVSQWQ
jgi:hypothetical protein